MFDLSNLNDYEFEILCKDIMQELLDEELFTFSRGVDAGVDICDKEKTPAIIIQVKHYADSTYSQFKSALKKEVAKIQRHHPKKYFICTSQSLTRKNKQEIIGLFDEFMPDISHVIDKNDINSFLEDEQNKDIVEKNYKLWLCASNVLSLVNNQNVFIDCSELMLDIEEQIKLFVETQAYHDAIKRLHQDNIIIIIGAPGVGKSSVSKMLLLHYADKGYKVRYVTNNNISEIKRSLSLAPNKKEIVLLDDFLGQHYLNLKDSQPNELKTLISFVTRSRRKKLILNSRVTIFNEAAQAYLTFREIMVRYEGNKYLLDLDKMSSLEKAKILYNHLYFNGLPQEYLSQVKRNKGYLRIVNHANYNPRVIEYVTQKYNYGTVSGRDYLQYIIGKLDNPEDVWKDEFRNRLDMNDRVLMNTLYSLSDTTVDSTVLERAFNKRIIREAKGDTSVNQYKESIIRLTDSLIKNVDDRGAVKITAINPSVNDYLFSEITSNPNEQIAIIDNAVFYEQIFRALKSDTAKLHYRKKLCSYDFIKMDTLKNTVFFYFLKSIVELHILDRSLKRKTTISLERAYGNLSYQDKEEYGQILHKLYSGEYCEFYKFHNTFLSSEKMFYILKPLMLDDAIELINAIMDDYDISNDEELMEVFKDHLVDKVSDCVRDELSDELTDAVTHVIDKAEREDIAGFMNNTTTFLEDAVWSELEDLAYEKIKENITNVNGDIDIDNKDFDVSDMCYYLDISNSIRSALKADYDEDDDRRYSHSESDTSLIVAMFER
ncbi:restriction endonuclease [Lacrimispora celerecrescens]|uniref:nSTAND3 domain-containing NTPase n=1 Tax=Lacrimispora celerecrescens TaxID=29354 RepID=UPI001646BF10|nr:restriction endonuclease [Lacrimispora celerecrescens]